MVISSPPQPAPLSPYNTYTSWPGGVDPSTPLFRTDNQKGGRSRKNRNNRKNRKASRKNRKASRKAPRKNSRR